jgi:hypothetical protein
MTDDRSEAKVYIDNKDANKIGFTGRFIKVHFDFETTFNPRKHSLIEALSV